MFKKLVLDLRRYTKSNNPLVILAIAFHNPGLIFSVFYRIERYLLYESNGFFRIIGLLFYPLYFFITYYILSYHIEPKVDIDGGLFLHNRDIVITDFCKIGKNFSIMGQTTIGTGFSSDTSNLKIIIKDDVKVGTGAKIIAGKGTLLIEGG